MQRFNKNPKTEAAGERIATLIADQILKRQRQLADQLNKWINRYPFRKQIKFFRLFCAWSILALCASLILTIRVLDVQKQDNPSLPTHIGQASGIPATVAYHRQLTDSLTQKK